MHACYVNRNTEGISGEFKLMRWRMFLETRLTRSQLSCRELCGDSSVRKQENFRILCFFWEINGRWRHSSVDWNIQGIPRTFSSGLALKSADSCQKLILTSKLQFKSWFVGILELTSLHWRFLIIICGGGVYKLGLSMLIIQFVLKA